MAEAWLDSFPPDPDELLDLLVCRIDDSMLWQIAVADDGMSAEQHYAPLRKFCRHKIVPELKWYPHEVLQLTRSQEPAADDERGQLRRAFASALLLRSYALPHTYYVVQDTILQLVYSVRVLNGQFVPAAIKLFAWCLMHPAGAWR